jgi:hypothetical protein
MQYIYMTVRLRVEFSVADLMDAPEEPDFEDLGGEENKGAEGNEEAYPQAYPIRVNVVVTKVCDF